MEKCNNKECKCPCEYSEKYIKKYPSGKFKIKDNGEVILEFKTENLSIEEKEQFYKELTHDLEKTIFKCPIFSLDAFIFYR